MAKIPLRAYINEIETIIDQQQTEEAIAHCRHILLIYPKHIDSYRMLGKAYLEGRHYSNAVDIFKRVLSAIPYDFISHVGMSIAHEDESNLDAAIWHMERAFEGQPYNAAIQGELRRLYGKRDGMEPPKIHLTRGALARMYTKGNLYQQAIAELRAALAEDPQRFDLQTFLAQVYFQSGKTAKAIEVCGTILKKLPYCLDANLLIAQLLETSSRSDEAEVYIKRVQELDPYQAYINPKNPNKEQVQDQAVLVEQLIWDGGPTVATGDQPEWAASVGVTLGDSRSVNDELPDWMDDKSEEVPKLPSLLDQEGGTEDQMIPDFMKDAGWGPSTGSFDESKSVFDVDEEDAPLEETEAVEGKIPDWLQQIAPPESIDITEAVAEIPDEFPSPTGEDVGVKPQDADLSDWLQDTEGGGDDPTGITGAATTTDIFGKDETEEEIPDWLSEIDAEQVRDAEITEIPDWLQDLDEDESHLGGVSVSDEGGDTELPDWLSQAVVGAAGVAGASAVADILSKDEGETVPATTGSQSEDADEVDLPDWLQEISEDQEEPAHEIAGKPVLAEGAEIPDWLQEVVDDKEPETNIEKESTVVAEAGSPEWLQDDVETENIEFSEDLESTPEDEIDVQKSLDEAESSTETELEKVDLDWAVKAAGGAASIAAAATAAEIFSDDNDEELEETEPETVIDEETSMIGEEEITEEGEEPISLDDAETTLADEIEIPDWLQDVSEEPEQPKSSDDVETTLADEIEIPDWLQDISEDKEPELVVEEFFCTC